MYLVFKSFKKEFKTSSNSRPVVTKFGRYYVFSQIQRVYRNH